MILQLSDILYCIISSVEDSKFLAWCNTIIKYVPKDIKFYVLRNKPLSQDIIEYVNNSLPQMTIKIVPNETYVNQDIVKGVKFVKLRYDSIMLSEPTEGSAIILGDDDMMFEEAFRDSITNNLVIFEKADYAICTHRVISGYSFDNCKFEGLRHGIFFKYNKKIIEEFGSYSDYYGGGEDSLMHEIFFKNGIWKNLRIIQSGINHVGGNMGRYFDAELTLQNNPIYTVYHCHKIANEISRTFIEEQNAKCLQFFEDNLKDLYCVNYITEDEKTQYEQYGYTFITNKITDKILLHEIPAKLYLTPPIINSDFLDGDKKLIYKYGEQIESYEWAKENIDRLSGILNIADTIRFAIPGIIGSFTPNIGINDVIPKEDKNETFIQHNSNYVIEHKVDELAQVFFTIEPTGIFINVKNKDAFITYYSNACCAIKLNIFLK